jgi:hypothetical protein
MKKCAHHWLIDTATGPTSPARCAKCGKEREFSNQLIYKRVGGHNEWRAPSQQDIRAMAQERAT